MKHADSGIKDNELDQLVRAHRQDAADQHLLDMLGALRGAVDHQDCCSGRDHIEHADEGLLPHAAHEAAARGQQKGSSGSKHKGVRIAGCARHRVSCHCGHGCSECRYLRESEIGKYHIAPQDLEAEPGMNTGEDHRCCERKRRESEDILQHGLAQFDAADKACAKATTLYSNSEK